MLQALGIDSGAATTYQALLRDPGATVTTLVRLTSLGEHQVSSAVEQLRQLGLIRPADGGGLAPADPKLALTALLRRREADVARQQQELAELRAAVSEAMAAWPRQTTASGTAVSQQEARALASRLMEGAESECLIALPDPATVLWPDGPPATLGARTAVLCLDAIRSYTRSSASLRALIRSGVHVRTSPLIPVPMVARDQAAALVWPGPGATAAPAVLIRDPEIVRVLGGIFTIHWDTARQLGEPDTADPATGLTRAEMTLLAPLANGHTDEAAARRLGVSTRTVQRQASRIIESLEATSRFQAGIAAARRGWV